MLEMLVTLVAATVTAVVFEPLMAIVHRYLFHGPLWCWHKSHHEQPTARTLVRNDLLWVWPLSAAGLLVAYGGVVLAGVGLGIATYVVAYIVAHDGVAHGRFRVPSLLRGAGLFRLVAETHGLHHRGGRDGAGAPPFGVYLAHVEYRVGIGADYSAPTKVCNPIVREARTGSRA